MKQVAILTDFASYDSAYSLCGVAGAQARILAENGGQPTITVKPGYPFDDLHLTPFAGCRLVELDQGRYVGNTVKVDEECGGEITSLVSQLEMALNGIDVVLTHDLIYQAAQWKLHVAARRFAKRRPEIRWVHWVHSATGLNVADQTGTYRTELAASFPNSKIAVFSGEELVRKAGAFGFEIDQTAVMPNPIDLTAHYHPAAQEAITRGSLWKADAVAVFPARLDRGKQLEIIIEILGAMVRRGLDARLVVVDFHSRGGDKPVYRTALKAQAAEAGVPFVFTSDLKYPDADYHIPHEAVMDLMDYADILIHPSKSEGDPLIIPEAAWARCALMLNFDLPAFRIWDGLAQFGRFSSNMDVTTGEPGATNTTYGNRRIYMDEMAGKLAYVLEHNPILAAHIKIRQTRSLEAHALKLWALVNANGA